MLTKDDLRLLEKLFDKKLKSLKTDVAAIETRVADLETGKITKLDFYEVKNTLNKVEKRLTAYETRLNRIENSMATKDHLKNFATKDIKKALKPIQSSIKRLSKNIKVHTRFFDGEHIELVKRVDRLDQHVNHPPIATS